MEERWDNPMGLDGFEFVEFSAPEKGMLEPVFEMMGFSPVAAHRSKDACLYRQGDINFIVNYERGSQASYFAQEHGPRPAPWPSGSRIRNRPSPAPSSSAASPWTFSPVPMELRLPAIRGIGHAPIYLIDRYEEGSSIYDIDFVYHEGVERRPDGCGFHSLDHLTHNVYRGRMAYWADYYERLFGFRELRTFDIKGEYTGLTSRAMTGPDLKIRIPLNEEASGKTDRSKSSSWPSTARASSTSPWPATTWWLPGTSFRRAACPS